MNQQQKNYLLKRIEGIVKEKIRAIPDIVLKEERNITVLEAVAMIERKQVKIKEIFLERFKETILKRDGARWSYKGVSPNINDIWDFSEFQSELVIDEDKKEKIIKLIKEEQANLSDKIMLGEEEQALILLEKFIDTDFNVLQKD